MSNYNQNYGFNYHNNRGYSPRNPRPRNSYPVRNRGSLRSYSPYPHQRVNTPRFQLNNTNTNYRQRLNPPRPTYYQNHQNQIKNTNSYIQKAQSSTLKLVIRL